MQRTLIIAEAGVNHNGDITLAKQLIDRAKEAGADFVKFQSFTASSIVTKTAQKAAYQEKLTSSGESQYEMLKRLELSENDHDVLIAYCAEKGIEFLSTPFDLATIQLLKAKGITIGKIPSGEVTNLPYLVAMAQNFPRLILSTGMCTLDEIKTALDVLTTAGAVLSEITVLHCSTEYPTPMLDVNLNAMLTIQRELGVKIGYSDHTKGIEVPIAAVALGASVIEKHFTLDRTMPGPDHQASLEPGELKEMVTSIRNIELAMGNGIKSPTAAELKNLPIVRKSIVAKKDLSAGHILSMDDLAVKRPGTGISPMKIATIVGKKLMIDIEEDGLLTEKHFQ